MKTSLVFLVACTLAASGHTSATVSRGSQALAAGQGARLRSSAALSEAQSLFSQTEATVDEKLSRFKPLSHPIRRFVAFLAEKAGIPLPTIDHQKTPGNGYSPGSPMFDDQERWVARNGDNVRLGGQGEDFAWAGPWQDVWANAYMFPLAFFGAMLLHIFLWVLIAYLYYRFAADWRRTRFLEQMQTQQEFLHTPWDIDCTSGANQFDWEICLCALFCPYMRWADTVSNSKMIPGKFWAAFLGMVVLAWLSPFTLGLSLFLIMPLVGVYFRQQMRTKFGHDAGKPWTWVYDTLLWCCCPCCAIAQEAREVEKVDPGFVRKVTAYSTY